MEMARSARHGGDRIAAILNAQGVRSIFTLCGGHISPILTAAKARGLRVVDCRHEATAVFAADASARLSGVPGVAVVTAGPGVTNSITALKNAQLAQSPVVVLGGAAPTVLQGRGALQDIDQGALVSPHVKLFRKVNRVSDLAPAVDQAFALARAGVRGPVFIECPVDLLYHEEAVRKWYADASGKGKSIPDRLRRWYLGRHLQKMFHGPDEPEYSPQRSFVPEPRQSAVESAAHELARAERPLLLVGSQAVALAQEVERVAGAVARLGIPVYLSGMARGLLGREHPLQMHHARREALRSSDCVILAGVPCDFRLDYGRHIRRSAVLISANRSAGEARLNRRPAVAAIGDPGRFLQSLASISRTGKVQQDWMADLRERDRARDEEIACRAQAEGDFVNPIRFFRDLDHAAGRNAIIVADGGDFVAASSYIVQPPAPLSWLDPGVFGTLGVGAGFALGAAFARPEAQVWIILGDGASGYGLVEFDTFVRHKVPVIGIVGNDASWSQIAREQTKLLHDDVGTVLARTDYHRVAEGFGAAGLVIRRNVDVCDALARARDLAASGKAVLVNVWLDRTDFREGSVSM